MLATSDWQRYLGTWIAFPMSIHSLIDRYSFVVAERENEEREEMKVYEKRATTKPPFSIFLYKTAETETSIHCDSKLDCSPSSRWGY